MPTLKSHRGISMVELLLGVLMISGVAATLSILLPRMSAAIMQNRQRPIANVLASTHLQTLKSQPYAFLDPTPASKWDPLDPTCNCDGLDFSVLSSTVSTTAGAIYTVRSCVHAVAPMGGNLWSSQCPPNDTGYKEIVVQVSWGAGTQTYTLRQESTLTRSML